MVRQTFSHVFVIVLILVLSATCACAESLQDTAPEALSKLDTLFDGEDSLKVGSINASRLAEFIVPEMRPMVERGYVEMVAKKKLPYSLRLDDSWAGLSQKNAKKFSVNPQSELVSSEAYEGGYFFEVSEPSSTLDGAKVLWNSQALMWGQGGLQTSARLTQVKHGQIENEFVGELVRVYPKIVEGSAKAHFVFRERLNILKPAFLEDYTWLTFRFHREREDMVWVYSPATEAVRVLTPSNRADSLFRFSLSPDDFFTWSGSVARERITQVSEQPGFVPFSEDTFTAVTDGDCVRKKVNGISNDYRTSLRWNFESRRYYEGADWLPTYVKYYPRSLVRVELEPQDPFSLYGTQVIYFDSESSLPLYKFVYNRAGKLWKLVVSAFDLAVTKKLDIKVFVPKFTVVDDLIKRESTLVEYETFKYCKGYPDKFSKESFDPKKILPSREESATASNSDNEARKGAH